MTMEPYENDGLGVFGQPDGNGPFDGEPENAANPSDQPDALMEGAPPAGAADDDTKAEQESDGAGDPGGQPEPAPKKKRVSRKKAEKAEEDGTPAEAPALTAEVSADEGAAAVGELHSDAMDDDLDAAGAGADSPGQDVLVMGLAEGAETPEATGPIAVPESDPLAGKEDTVAGDRDLPATPAANVPPATREQRMARPRENRPVSGHAPLMSLNLNELDRNLSREEQQEWNDIYASFRSKSVLTGRIIGVDPNSFYVRNKNTGALERRRMYCAVVIAYRVKVLIPETEFWMPGEERPSHVFRNLTGAEIDYTILDVDREGGVAIASRRMGAASRRHFFGTVRGGHPAGERLTCRVLSVGPTRCLLECGGYDITLGRRDMSYSSIYDLREKYKRGQVLDCIVTSYDRAAEKLEISVREAEPHPFQGITSRHPLGSRRQAVISGKYGGGVFCTLPDGTTCLCLYTAQHTDRDFHIGDTILLVIVQFDEERSLVYGRILSKW